MAHIETRVLRPTNPSGALSASGGAANRIAVFSGASTLGTSANFTYNTSTESFSAGDSASSSSVHSFNGRALSLTYNVSGGDANISIAHNQNTASSGAGFVAQVAGGSAGDAYMIYTVVAATQWIHGIDNSASDTFKLSYGNALGTNDFLQVNTAGKFTIGATSGTQLHDVNGRGFNVVYGNSGVTAYVQASHSSNTAGSGVCYYLQVAGTSAGDASITFDVLSTAQWSVGCDTSNSRVFSISNSSTLGTNEYFRIRNSDGKVYIGLDGGSQTHNIQGDGLSFRRSAGTVTFDISNSTSDGGITINGDTGTSAGACIQVFGSTSSNPSYTLFRNANTQTGSILNTGVWSIGPNAGGVTHRFNTNTQTTVGAAGAASALPANPTGYWIVNFNGTEQVVPYYAKS